MSKKTLKVASRTHEHTRTLEAKKKVDESSPLVTNTLQPRSIRNRSRERLAWLSELVSFHTRRKTKNTLQLRVETVKQSNICDSSYSVTSSAENLKRESIKSQSKTVGHPRNFFKIKASIVEDRTEHIKITRQALISVNGKTQTCSCVVIYSKEPHFQGMEWRFYFYRFRRCVLDEIVGGFLYLEVWETSSDVWHNYGYSLTLTVVYCHYYHKGRTL